MFLFWKRGFDSVANSGTQRVFQFETSFWLLVATLLDSGMRNRLHQYNTRVSCLRVCPRSALSHNYGICSKLPVRLESRTGFSQMAITLGRVRRLAAKPPMYRTAAQGGDLGQNPLTGFTRISSSWRRHLVHGLPPKIITRTRSPPAANVRWPQQAR